MYISGNLNVKDPGRLLDLTEMFGANDALRSGWPSDLMEAVATHRSSVYAIMGRKADSASPTYNMFERLSVARLVQIWELLLCPWCGLETRHEEKCPLAVEPPLDFERALAAWQIAYRNARHSPGYPVTHDPRFRPFAELGRERASLAGPLPAV